MVRLKQHWIVKSSLNFQPDELESEKLRSFGIPSFHSFLSGWKTLSLVARCILFPFVSIFQQLRFKGANVRDKKS